MGTNRRQSLDFIGKVMTTHDVRNALDVFLKLSEPERRAVLCWFCDACAAYVGPGESHYCSMGSAIYPPKIKAEPSQSMPHDKTAFWKRVMHNKTSSPIERQCHHKFPSKRFCGCPIWKGSKKYCYWHDPERVR